MQVEECVEEKSSCLERWVFDKEIGQLLPFEVLCFYASKDFATIEVLQLSPEE